MTDQAPDDVFALYSHFDLDEKNYRVFLRESAISASPAAVSEPAEKPKAVLVEEHSAERQYKPNDVAAIPLKDSALAPRKVPTVVSTHYAEDSRAALQGLWRHVGSSRDGQNSGSGKALAAASISVHGAAGGVGTTTIAAILTRLLSKSGRHCAIFDETDDPTLPIFFGAQHIADGHRRFSGLRSMFEPRIRILKRQMFAPPENCELEEAAFIERSFAALPHPLDHLIFDHPPRDTQRTGAGLELHVAVPDLRSIAGMQALKRIGDGSQTGERTICVLNRFDPTSALHKELLGWYRETFRELIVVDESPLVPEALAEGTTLLDWAPDASASTDFLNLFASVSRLLSSEPERLPLCS